MQIDPNRLREELTRMRELIATDPEVLAHFDTDGNGVIDGEEWDAVRQLVIQRLEREAAEAELARQLQESLDPRQAAELARMEADIAGEDVNEPASESQADELPPVSKVDEIEVDFDAVSGGQVEVEHGTPSQRPGQRPESRDFEGLELAFDPREDRATQNQSLADELYERELAGRYAAGARDARSVRLSEAGTMADCNELILEQSGGAKQFFGNMFRREYVVRDADGQEIGRIGQRENEMLQNLTDYSILEDPDINFSVHDGITGEQFHFRRTSGFTDNTIAVFNPQGRVIARTSWTLSFLRRKYEVRVVKEGMSYYVRRRMLKPWTFDVLDPFEEPIGTMQRGWSGLGFLTGGNLFHIEVEGDVSPDAMWGFLATALLADLDSEAGSRKAGFDFFNE